MQEFISRQDERKNSAHVKLKLLIYGIKDASLVFEKFENRFKEVSRMSRKPDSDTYTKYPADHIFDEDKSVRWNREEVTRRNDAYREETLRLRADYIAADNAAKDLAIAYIEQETNMNNEQAGIYFAYIYGKYHSFITDLIYYIDEMVELYNSIQNAAK